MNLKKKYIIYFLIHIIFNTFIVFYFKFSFVENWDFFWQNIPFSCLKNFISKDFYYLHSQPPLHQLLGFVLLKLFGETYFYAAYKILHIFLGSLFVILHFILLDLLIRNNLLKKYLMLIIFFNPGTFLFGNYLLYTLNSGLFLVTGILFFWFFLKYKDNDKLFFITFLLFSILILYRSSFHIILLPLILVFIALRIKLTKKRIIVFCFIVFFPFSWYLKNYCEYNFFGISSWLGLNLYKFITTDLGRRDNILIRKNLNLPEVVTKNNHFYSDFKKYRKFGYNKNFARVYLNQDNWQNGNVPELSEKFKFAALKMIMVLPKHYCANVFKAYFLFSKPGYTYPHLKNNSDKIITFIKVYDLIAYPLNYLLHTILKQNFYPFNLIFFPLSIVLYFIIFFKNKKQISNKFYFLTFILGILLYYSIISCFIEVGENNRFRFVVENLFFIYFFTIIDACIHRGKMNE